MFRCPNCVLQEYVNLREALEVSLRAGFLNLSKARYTLGADRVSSAAVPAQMQASLRLQPTGKLLGIDAAADVHI